MSWLASSDPRLQQRTAAVTLLVALAIGGCGGGGSGSPDGQKPAKVRVGSGTIQTDRLSESVAKQKAAPRPAK